jgi:hypothetical protein
LPISPGTGSVTLCFIQQRRNRQAGRLSGFPTLLMLWPMLRR